MILCRLASSAGHLFREHRRCLESGSANSGWWCHPPGLGANAAGLRCIGAAGDALQWCTQHDPTNGHVTVNMHTCCCCVHWLCAVRFCANLHETVLKVGCANPLTFAAGGCCLHAVSPGATELCAPMQLRAATPTRRKTILSPAFAHQDHLRCPMEVDANSATPADFATQTAGESAGTPTACVIDAFLALSAQPPTRQML